MERISSCGEKSEWSILFKQYQSLGGIQKLFSTFPNKSRIMEFTGVPMDYLICSLWSSFVPNWQHDIGVHRILKRVLNFLVSKKQIL